MILNRLGLSREISHIKYVFAVNLCYIHGVPTTKSNTCRNERKILDGSCSLLLEWDSIFKHLMRWLGLHSVAHSNICVHRSIPYSFQMSKPCCIYWSGKINIPLAQGWYSIQLWDAGRLCNCAAAALIPAGAAALRGGTDAGCTVCLHLSFFR